MSSRRGAIFTAAAFLPAMFTFLLWRERRALPETSGEIRLPGLGGEVEVAFDSWGVPHVRAETMQDALYAQGFLTARDRLVQMELYRRVAGGRLAEVYGEAALSLDVFMRNLGLERVSKAIPKSLPDHSLACLQSYTAGVNVYLECGKKAMPPEMWLLARGRPKLWKLEDSLAVQLLFSWSSDAGWTTDLMKARLYRELGKEAAEYILRLSETDKSPALDHGNDGGAQDAPLPPLCGMEFFPNDEMNPPWMVSRAAMRGLGSSSWVVGSERAAGGKPLLCVDTHAPHVVPTLYYLCHLQAAEHAYNVIGASIPGIPGLIMGRNESLAWVATSLCADVTDLYVESFQGGEGNRYLYGDDYVDAQTVDEEIRVFPKRSHSHRVVITRHGPVIYRRGSKGLALRWAGHDTPNDSVGCMIRLGMARDWDQFVSSLEGYGGPSLNLIYADVEGNIGYCAAARIPVRRGCDGSLPLPGESDAYDWEGYVPMRDMPRALNPEKGWIVAADSRVVAGRYPFAITTAGDPPARQARIHELLSSKHVHDVRSMRNLQADVYNRRGDFLRRELGEAAASGKAVGNRLGEALDIMRWWDAMADEDSVAQSLFSETWRVLTERVLRHRLGHGLYYQYLTSFRQVNEVVESILREKRHEWLHPSANDFGDMLLQCLEEAVLRLENRFGTSDMRRWRWGALNKLDIPHQLGLLMPLRRMPGLGTVECRGDAETICCSLPESDATVQIKARSSFGCLHESSDPPRHYGGNVHAGTVLRMILDLSEKESSLWCLDVGQSSNPYSRFFRNFNSLWRRRDYALMAFRNEEVSKVTLDTLRLIPASGAAEGGL